NVARIDLLFCLARHRSHIVSNNADADVVKILVHEVGEVALFFRQGMTFVATGFGVEEIPASLGGVVDCVLFACDEVIEGSIEGKLGALVSSNRTRQIGAGRWAAEDSLKRLLVFSDGR